MSSDKGPGISPGASSIRGDIGQGQTGSHWPGLKAEFGEGPGSHTIAGFHGHRSEMDCPVRDMHGPPDGTLHSQRLGKHRAPTSIP